MSKKVSIWVYETVAYVDKQVEVKSMMMTTKRLGQQEIMDITSFIHATSLLLLLLIDG